METNLRKTVSEKLKVFDYIAKDDDFIEVSEWSNGEGWDITINDRHFHLTYGTLDAINYLTKAIDIEFKDKVACD